jgi:predicted RNase H-like HicB family nuclease
MTMPQLKTRITIAIWREDEDWVSQCLEFDVSSAGASPDEAAEEAGDAVESYVHTLEELGERDRVFAERAIATYRREPPEFRFPRLPTEMLQRQDWRLRTREIILD